jgi:S-formylglutathione hydrolase
MEPAQLLKTVKVHGGELRRYRHASSACACDMTFAVFVPPQALLAEAPAAAASPPAPLVLYLSGLTCSDVNASEKAGAFAAAAAHGLALVLPDTSPRGEAVLAAAGAEATAHWDFGIGAGFYLDATRAPWSSHWRMESYISEELPGVLRATLPRALAHERCSIMGHSMGGCGALALALKRPGAYRAATAFAPVAHPSACPWGRKAFTGYLGEEGEAGGAWARCDPTALVAAYKGPPLRIRIDVGTGDEWLAKGQLLQNDFCAAAAAAGVPVELHLREGYVRVERAPPRPARLLPLPIALTPPYPHLPFSVSHRTTPITLSPPLLPSTLRTTQRRCRRKTIKTQYYNIFLKPLRATGYFLAALEHAQALPALAEVALNLIPCGALVHKQQRLQALHGAQQPVAEV